MSTHRTCKIKSKFAFQFSHLQIILKVQVKVVISLINKNFKFFQSFSCHWNILWSSRWSFFRKNENFYFIVPIGVSHFGILFSNNWTTLDRVQGMKVKSSVKKSYKFQSFFRKFTPRSTATMKTKNDSRFSRWKLQPSKITTQSSTKAKKELGVMMWTNTPIIPTTSW